MARPATAHKIAQTVIAAIRPSVQTLDIAAILLATVVARVLVAAIPPVMAAARVLVAAIRPSAMVVVPGSTGTTRQPVTVVVAPVLVAASRRMVATLRVVAVTRDRAAVEVERLRSCRKSEHYPVDLLRNWRIFAYYCTPDTICIFRGKRR